jgi:hypothetical protein
LILRLACAILTPPRFGCFCRPASFWVSADGAAVLHPQVPSQASRPKRRQGLARVEKFEEVEPDRHKRSEGDPGSALPHAEQLYLRFGVSDDVLERALEGGVGRRRMIIAAAFLHSLPPPARCPKRRGDA